MARNYFAFIVCMVAFSVVNAQSPSLYMPRNITRAFIKGTRSSDGNPGPRYWQNYARYNIHFTALPPGRNVTGVEQISYINNSPDTLKSIVFRLVLNVHKPGAVRARSAGADYLTDGIIIDSFSINNKTARWTDNKNDITYKTVSLLKDLLPHDSVQINIGWHFQISLQSGREGMIDSTTYYLAYAYPRVSVYDDYYGWDRLDFTDTQEFYNDFNDYTFTVTAPKNYIVWATGVLQNAPDVLQPEYEERLKNSYTSDSVIHVATLTDLAGKNITAQNEVNTWKWKADYVSDITIGLSDHYVWDASSVVVDSATQRRVSVQAAFNDKANDFHYATANARYTLSWLSGNWPGVPYPFPKMTVFQGFADMEYPMMINDGSNADVQFSRFVADHEIAHSYFPFYMGINESRYAFMDEGWATTLELLIARSEIPAEQADNFYKRFRVNGWIHDISAEEDLPVITPANVLKGVAYGNNAYGKPSLGYFAMKDMLGDDLFKKCLHAYMDRWHGKHPIPWDFFNTFNNVAGKDLNWFWNSWYFTNNYIDLAIKDVSPKRKGYKLTVQNIGGYPAPFDVKVTYADGSSEVVHETPAVWQNNQQQAIIEVPVTKEVKTIAINGGIFMDADETNNVWKAE
jgi:hypothetical protein